MDEILEYKEYIEGKRPRPDTFKEELDGIRRPLLILARKALEDNKFYEEENKENRNQIIEQIKKQVLEDYCQKHGLGDKIVEYEKSWNAGTAIYLKDHGVNTSSKISFDDIIAEAVNTGYLKRWVLRCKDNYIENLKIIGSKSKQVVYKPLNLKNEKDEIHTDRILKIIAICLIKGKLSQQNENVIKYCDFSNWVNKNIEGKNLRIFFYEKEGEIKPLFQRRSIVNRSKVSICQDYIKDYDFEVLEEKEADALPKDGYLIFKDPGFGGYFEQFRDSIEQNEIIKMEKKKNKEEKKRKKVEEIKL